MQESHETDAQRRARNLGALLDMGFECVEGPLTTESLRVDARHWRVAQSLPAMGTVVTVSVLDESTDRGEAVIGAAFEAMQDDIDLLNRFESASALGVLNSESVLADAPDALLQVLHRARGIHLLSAGAFDVTVAPVIDLFRARRDAGLTGLPEERELRTATRRINADGIGINGREVRLDEGVRITLDGIAKGYIVDRMATGLAQAGVRGYLVNGGGDIRAGGTRNGVDPWRVGVRDPDVPDAELDVLALREGAVATSGSYEIYFDRDHTRHHIVSSDGASPGECRAVTVRAPSTMLADALATAAFVAGPAAGARLVESVPGCSAFVVDAAGAQHLSSSWRPDGVVGSRNGAP